MAGEWRDITFDQLGRIITGKTPPSSVPGYFGGDIPFVTPTDFDGRRVIDATGRCLTEQGGKVVSRSRIPCRAVMVSCIGSDMGKAAIAGRECVTNQQINSIVVESGDDPLFVYYNLSIRKAEIRAAASGSAQPILNKSGFGQFNIFLPPPREQRAIAHILGTLDDKIELNRRMNETLEAMARALFKSWFVDFDPVRAKCRGEPMCSPQSGQAPHSGHAPKSDHAPQSGQAHRPAPTEWPQHILDLFPDRFADSEFGEIPEGWEVASLPDVIEVNPTRALRKGAVAPYLGMANIPTRGHSPDVVADRPFGSGMRFMNGDTLVARITPCLENGKTAYVDFLDDGQVGWGSTEYIVLRPRAPLPTEFAYCLARDSNFREFAIQSMTGSSGRQRVPAESLAHFQVVTAPKPIAEAFGQLIKPLFARASAGTWESRALAALRDTLLPKLLSGELRVKDEEE